jgi:poly(3-hydroxybutyrate) depolymerase
MRASIVTCAALALFAFGCEGAVDGSDPGGSGGSMPGTGAQSGGGGAAPGSGGAGANLGGTAGSGGSAGLGGSGGGSGATGGAGQSGSGGMGAAGQAGSGGGSTPTSGCGTAATQDLEQWVEGTLDVGGTARRWWVRLPGNYDASRAYPVVFLFHGCGNETNNVPMQNVTGDDAILVRSVAVEDCWDTGRDTADVAFFDAMVAAVSQNHCVDSSRLFAAGYSSGSWLINLLECVRGDVLRAAGSVAGGTPFQPECVGTVARIFVHDLNDNDNSIDGNLRERDRLLELNGCDTSLPALPEEPAPCARYQGCDPEHPVIWCETSGEGHSRQDALAAEAFWGLFSEL